MEHLHDLEKVLMFNKAKLTPEEANILPECKSKGERDSTVGAIAGYAAVWAATWKLSKPLRFSLSAGAGAFLGVWMLVKTEYSCTDQILKMDGSILQKELSYIMVTKYQNDPLLKLLISKHFYSERVFDDSTSNTPKLRWRYRNFFSDGHRTHDHDSYDKFQGDSHHDSYDKSQGEFGNVTNSQRTNLETKPIFIKPGLDIMSDVDTLDCLFGYGAPVEEIHHPNTPNKPSGTHTRGHRRSHRRRRMRNHDDLSNSEHSAAA